MTLPQSPLSYGRGKPTPGPWEIAGATHIFAAGPLGANIATVSSPRAAKMVGYAPLEFGDTDSAEAYANARLIAAAPDLLAALIAYHEHFGPLEDNHMLNEECRRCAKLARAAIAKATGTPP